MHAISTRLPVAQVFFSSRARKGERHAGVWARILGCVCVYIHAGVCTHECCYVCVHTCCNVCMCTHMLVCVCVCTCMLGCVWGHAGMYVVVCVHVYTHVGACAQMLVCMCTHMLGCAQTVQTGSGPGSYPSLCPLPFLSKFLIQPFFSPDSG